jgi:phage terminase large subunit-like protein
MADRPGIDDTQPRGHERPHRDPRTFSVAEKLAVAGTLGPFVEALDPAEAERLMYDWAFWRRPTQREPSFDWRWWMVRAGRGFGKTRLGAETVRARVAAGQAGRIAIVAPTAGDARDVMVEGESGLIVVHPQGEQPTYEPSKRRITWANGAQATTFSAEEPDRLRGPAHDLAWADEPASWRYGEEAFDNLALGLRLGDCPQGLLTMTPKRRPWLRKLEAQPDTAVTIGTTYENLLNLAPTFIADILDRYEGTRLGAQELHAEYLDDVEGALWTQAVIDGGRVAHGPGGVEWRTVVGVDPPGETAECGIVTVVGPARPALRGQAYVLDDRSLAGPPETWGRQVVGAYYAAEADEIIVEANQGGDMCRAVIHAVDPTVRVRKVRAKFSKAVRAEPVAARYARGYVHHVGYFGALESQMTTWVPTDERSPDRIDALVWAVSDLLPEAGVVEGRVASVAGRTLPA